MNNIIKIFGYQFYVKELLVVLFSYLFMENIFSWLVLPNSIILLKFEKVASLIIFGFVLYNYTNLKRNEQVYIGVFCFLILKLVFESLLKFGNLFEQFTMFSILFPVVFAIYIKCICRSLELDLLEFLAKFYITIYIIMMLIYGRGFSFSLEAVVMTDYGPFSGDSRIIHARTIFMLIIPLLWYLDRFLKDLKAQHFILLAFCLVAILAHQHRSVWASAIFSVSIYLVLSFRNKLISAPKFVHIVLVTLIAVFALGTILAYAAPQLMDLLSVRFADILDPNKEGSTGEFRKQQREVYLALFTKRPLFGWTFEGFDMPNPMVDWWPERSGQHFHEGYVEMLFYEGITGFLLKYWLLFYLGYKAFSKKLNHESIILIAFALSGFIFSFSYVLPLIFWGHVGLCLYYLQKQPIQQNSNPDHDEPVSERTSSLVSSHAFDEPHYIL